MVRVFLKGGVWKNSEDEILKAAVQKYGKQQWARVASLLNRKTAKQAKARWQEWLDPSIRKVEWTQQEEQQLLYLAKLLPAQWKTIAPMIGRTAVQCQEHYEKLLDDAAASGGGAAAAAVGASTDAMASLREQTVTSLRPGQIDSHPETKPAKPDPIDMDEDEMEMLQEARARLANTQGKKAKRKQRERILNQAKRLADLQKRRELKQAGIISSNARKKSSKRKNEIDFGVEIPFYKEAPGGFHDTTQEQQFNEIARQKRLTKVNFQQVNENLYRTRDKETEQLKQREMNRLRLLEQSNEQYMNAAASSSSSKKREEEEEYNRLGMIFKKPLQLPEPKTEATATNDDDDDDDGNDNDIDSAYYSKSMKSRKSLRLNDDDNNDGMTLTSQHTKRSQQKSVISKATTSIVPASTRSEMMEQARQLRALDRTYENPLLYDLNTVEQQGVDEVDDDDDQKLPAVDTTKATIAPILSIRDLARQQKKALKEAQMALQQALASLPVPQYEYDVAIPEEDEKLVGETMDDDKMDVDDILQQQPDQADVEEQELEKRRLQAIKEYERQSSVVKRPELPRPTMQICTMIQPQQIQLPTTSSTISQKYENECSLLVAKEVQALLYHDAINFPVVDHQYDINSSKKKKKRKQNDTTLAQSSQVPEFEDISDEAISTAKKMIDEEYNTLLQEKIDMVLGDGYATNVNDAIQFLTSINTRSTIDNNTASNEATTIECMQAEYEILNKVTNKMMKKNDKIIAKLQITNGGYIKRGNELSNQIQDTHAKILESSIEEGTYHQLHRQEAMGYEQRIQQLQKNVQSLRDIESQLQKKYNHLLIEKRRKDVLLR